MGIRAMCDRNRKKQKEAALAIACILGWLLGVWLAGQGNGDYFLEIDIRKGSKIHISLSPMPVFCPATAALFALFKSSPWQAGVSQRACSQGEDSGLLLFRQAFLGHHSQV